MQIKDSTVIVTGAAKGLGREIVNLLIEKEANVLALDKDQQALDQLPERERLHKYVLDLLDDAQRKTVIRKITDQFKITALVNNAGVLHNHPVVRFEKGGLTKLSNEEWFSVLDINLNVPFMLSRDIAAHMIKKRIKGVLINISSISAQGNAGQAAYSASKAGLEAMTKVLSKELGVLSIRAACIAPGYMDTPSTHQVMKEGSLQKIVKDIPLRRLGKAQEVARGVCFIIENDFYSGKTLSIDGGLTL